MNTLIVYITKGAATSQASGLKGAVSEAALAEAIANINKSKILGKTVGAWFSKNYKTIIEFRSRKTASPSSSPKPPEATMTPSQIKKMKAEQDGQAENPVTKAKPQKPPPDDYKTYQTHGIRESPLESSDGRRMVADFEKRGLTKQEAIDQTKDLMATGSTRPMANPVETGDRLFKVIPEGGSVGQNSPYFMTKAELDLLKGLDSDAIGSRLGLPLESQKTGKFEVVEVKAMLPTIVYDAKIAATTQNGWSQTGGGIQTLITDRSAFTAPVRTGIKLP